MAGETGEAAGAGLRRFPTRRRALIGGIAGIAAIVCIAVVLNVVGGGDGLSSIDGSQPTRSYVAVFLLVFLDAEVPIFPGETTLDAAATAAAQGTLELASVVSSGLLTTAALAIIFIVVRKRRATAAQVSQA